MHAVKEDYFGITEFAYFEQRVVLWKPLFYFMLKNTLTTLLYTGKIVLIYFAAGPIVQYIAILYNNLSVLSDDCRSGFS